jgi:SWIB/MDM2 domain-containing protein
MPEKKTSEVKVNALQKPLQLSEELAAVIGSGPLPRGQVVSKIWEYIRSHNLQNPENRREIVADDQLRRVFGKDKVTMFEMNKCPCQIALVTPHPGAFIREEILDELSYRVKATSIARKKCVTGCRRPAGAWLNANRWRAPPA